MSETLSLRGTLEGHAGWVTAIATPLDPASDVVLSASRDKSVIVWNLTREEGAAYGHPRRALRGHSHFVQDVVISSDGQFALSGSWDGTLRLWDLTTGATTRRFLGHTKDVLSVAFSVDNRQIVSGSRDRTIKLWNTIGECKYTIGEPDGHSEWVSCVRFSPAPANPIIVSAGWDKLVKVPFFFRFCFFRFCFFRNEVFLFLSQSLSVFLSFFLLLLPLLLLSSPPPPPPAPPSLSTHPFLSLISKTKNLPRIFQVWNLTNCKLRFNLVEHTGYVAAVTVSPDGSLCASGGKDGVARLWDLAEGKRLYSLDAGDAISALTFSPNRYWLCAATASCVKIWDLESKSTVVELRPDFPPTSKKGVQHSCTSLAWSADGATLYTGYTDGVIRVWGVNRAI